MTSTYYTTFLFKGSGLDKVLADFNRAAAQIEAKSAALGKINFSGLGSALPILKNIDNTLMLAAQHAGMLSSQAAKAGTAFNPMASGATRAAAATKSVSNSMTQLSAAAGSAASAAGRTTGAMSSLGAAGRGAFNGIVAGARSAVTALGSVTAAAATTTRAMGRMGMVAAAPFAGMKGAAMWASPLAMGALSTYARPGDIAALGAGYGLYKSMGFEREARLAAVRQGWISNKTYPEYGGLTGAELRDQSTKQMKDLASQLALSSYSAYGPSDIMQSINEAAALGISPQKMNAQMVDAWLNFSKVAEMDTATSAKTLFAQVVAREGLSGVTGENFEKYSDYLSTLANISPLRGEDLTTALKKSTPVASAYGQSIESQYSSIAALSLLGMQPQEADAAYRRMLLRLTPGWNTLQEQEAAELGENVTKTGKEKDLSSFNAALKGIGLKWEDVMPSGNLDLVNVAKTLNDKLKGMSDLDRNAFLKTIAGIQGITPLLSLMQNPDLLDSLVDQFENVSGATKDSAKYITDDFQGSLEKLKAAADVAAIKVGNSLSPAFQKFTDYVRESIPALEEFGSAIISGDWGKAGGMLENFVNNAAPVLANAFESLGDWIEKGIDSVNWESAGVKIGSLIDSGIQWGIDQAEKLPWEKIATAAGNALTRIAVSIDWSDAIAKAFDAGLSIGQQIIAGIMASNIPMAISNLGAQIYNAFTPMLASVAGAFTMLKQDIGSALQPFTYAWNSMKDAVNYYRDGGEGAPGASGSTVSTTQTGPINPQDTPLAAGTRVYISNQGGNYKLYDWESGRRISGVTSDTSVEARQIIAQHGWQEASAPNTPTSSRYWDTGESVLSGSEVYQSTKNPTAIYGLGSQTFASLSPEEKANFQKVVIASAGGNVQQLGLPGVLSAMYGSTALAKSTDSKLHIMSAENEGSWWDKPLGWDKVASAPGALYNWAGEQYNDVKTGVKEGAGEAWDATYGENGAALKFWQDWYMPEGSRTKEVVDSYKEAEAQKIASGELKLANPSVPITVEDPNMETYFKQLPPELQSAIDDSKWGDVADYMTKATGQTDTAKQYEALYKDRGKENLSEILKNQLYWQRKELQSLPEIEKNTAEIAKEEKKTSEEGEKTSDNTKQTAENTKDTGPSEESKQLASLLQNTLSAGQTPGPNESTDPYDPKFYSSYIGPTSGYIPWLEQTGEGARRISSWMLGAAGSLNGLGLSSGYGQMPTGPYTTQEMVNQAIVQVIPQLDSSELEVLKDRLVSEGWDATLIINVQDAEAWAAKSALQQDTSSTHWIYVNTIYTSSGSRSLANNITGRELGDKGSQTYKSTLDYSNPVNLFKIPAFAEGGYTGEYEGLAYLHPHERVIPDSKAQYPSVSLSIDLRGATITGDSADVFADKIASRVKEELHGEMYR